MTLPEVLVSAVILGISSHTSTNSTSTVNAEPCEAAQSQCQARPSKAKTGQAKPGHGKPSQAKAGQIEPSQAKCISTELVQSGPAPIRFVLVPLETSHRRMRHRPSPNSGVQQHETGADMFQCIRRKKHQSEDNKSVRSGGKTMKSRR